MNDTLAKRFSAAAEQSPYGVRFLDRDENELFFAYPTLLQRAQRTAARLVAIGVSPGDRVGIILPTAPEFYDAFFGSLLAGAVPTPLYPPVRLGRLDEYHETTARMLTSVDASLILTDERLHRLLGRTRELARPRLGCIALEKVGPLFSEKVGGRFSGGRADDLAVIQFSSGTTVDPKPVCLTNRQILANIDAITAAIFERVPEDGTFEHSGVSWLPLYHDMGLIGCVLTAALKPRNLTLIPPELFVARPALWLRAISRYRATVSAAPNFAYGLCAARIDDRELGDVDLSTWRFALNGAEPVTAAALSRFIERFGRHGLRPEAMTPVYGLAEATLAATFSDPREPFHVESFDEALLSSKGQAVKRADGQPVVSVGRALPGNEVQVVQSGTDTQASDGELGEIRIRGPAVMQGYFHDAERTAEALKNGWLMTGDTGFMLRGELYIYGRKKDLLIVRGRKYAPQTVEHVVDEIPGVRVGCSAAISVPSPASDSEVVVILTERDRKSGPENDPELAQQIIRHVSERTGLVPTHVQILAPGTLPRTSSGKLRRGEARTRYQASLLTQPERVTVLRMVRELARSFWAHRRAGRDARP